MNRQAGLAWAVARPGPVTGWWVQCGGGVPTGRCCDAWVD